MMGHNICFKVVIWKISPKLSLFSWSSVVMVAYVSCYNYIFTERPGMLCISQMSVSI